MHKDQKMAIKVGINDAILNMLKESKEYAGCKISRTSKEICVFKEGVWFIITLKTEEAK